MDVTAALHARSYRSGAVKVTPLLLLLLAADIGAQAPDVGGALTPFTSRDALEAYLRAAVPPAPRPAPCIGPELQLGLGPLSPGSSHGAVITGSVTDFAGTPIPGAVVQLPAMSRYAQANALGEYVILVPRGVTGAQDSLVLRARYLAFRPQLHTIALKAGDSLRADIRMCPSETRLDESISTGPTTVAPPSIGREGSDAIDEGGIVRRHGDHLVILRRGRLFTVAVGDRSMRPVAQIDVFPPGLTGGGWHRDMALHGDRIIVAGHTWRSHGTELNVFRIDGKGQLQYVSSYHHRSNRDESTDQRPLRIVGDRLVFYSSIDPVGWHGDLSAILPAVRRWRPPSDTSEFREIASPRRVYTMSPTVDGARRTRLHTVTSCDLTRDPFACDATVIVGPPATLVHVGAVAVHVWTNAIGGRRALSPEAMLYRMPLDGSAPRALRVAGVPLAEASFSEAGDGHVHVLVHEAGERAAWQSAARGMWRLGLWRIDASSFGDGSRAAPPAGYRSLAAFGQGVLQYRFVGEHLLYGLRSRLAPDTLSSTVVSVPLRGGDTVSTTLPHTIAHIEPMGTDAAVIGEQGGEVHVSVIRPGAAPGVRYWFSHPGGVPEDLRSFLPYYEQVGPRQGVLGLPILTAAGPPTRRATNTSAAVLYLVSDGRSFRAGGTLEASEWLPIENCRSTCIIRYSLARPLFIDGRILALLNYELVEAALRGSRISEIGRTWYLHRGDDATRRH